MLMGLPWNSKSPAPLMEGSRASGVKVELSAFVRALPRLQVRICEPAILELPESTGMGLNHQPVRRCCLAMFAVQGRTSEIVGSAVVGRCVPGS
jgi:hypothetical protein